MTTNAQRWGSRYRTVAAEPAKSPTMADIHAKVYSLTYLYGCVKHVIRVLAADPEHAAAHGAIRLTSQGDPHPPAPFLIDEMKWADVAMKVAIASYEHADEWQARQDAYQPAGKP